ncbi:unnamed protein product, partial [Brassica oleracea]
YRDNDAQKVNRPSLHLLLPTNVFQPQFRLQFHINSFKTSLLYIRPVQMNLNPATTHSYKFTATHDLRYNHCKKSLRWI